ncbi:MAG: DMT family transporter [Acidobacteriota bacterium]|nr:DMT family transporter [Acidobacteriota bacterium]MDH3522786.1 DMT family transporter [Acidobacteriota bacterium]
MVPLPIGRESRLPPRYPLLLIALSAVCFALMGVATKLAAGYLSGGQISFARFVAMLAPVLLVPSLRRRATTFERGDLLLYRGVLGGLAALIYFLAIQHIPIGLATLLNFTSPVFSVIFAALFLREGFDPRLLAPVAVVLAGVALAAGADAPSLGAASFGRWELAALGSAVLAGAAVTAVRAARRTESSWSIYGSFSLFGLLAAAPVALVDLPARLPAIAWLWLALVAASAIAAQLLMTFAYRWVTNLQAGIVLQLTVVLSLAAGTLGLGERLTALQTVGCAVTLAGVIGVILLHAPPRAVT